MDLILWRHADAANEVEGVPDLERPLTKKGERQAKQMGQWLQQHLPETTRILVSPAVRTRQTADALGRKYRVVPALGPDGNLDGLLHFARWPDAKEPVLVVGHQPTLGFVAAYLLAGVAQTWTVRSGAVWWLRRRQRNGETQVVLHTVLSSDSL